MNLYFGLLFFVGFLATGYYMAEYFKPNNVDNYVARMQIRANHIYILFISLLNIISFKSEIKMDHSISKYLNILFRILILIAGIISFVAFLKDHTGNLKTRNWTLTAIILSVLSISMVLLNELISYIIKIKKSVLINYLNKKNQSNKL
ncbi:hypothetical protein ACSIGC_09435 [Tenacibaculum sp. ZS6-P6]|uniref:hypothetical protein n=1 Tax=Tenacibaculum sp. ZS6-P6 TaxID=3447503 RepID=UPI003F956DA8